MTAALVLLLLWSLALRVWLATPNLTGDRFWDENYGVDNLCGLLLRHEPRPVNGFHPGLSYLPQAALLAASEGLHRWTGSAAFAVFQGEDDLAPAGYLLCRLLQALAGTLSLYLTFRIGRRLASPGVGLAAALLLALAPWHLRQSVIFKPDIWLVACSLLALLASLELADRPAARTALAAGAAVGLALAAKFNAAPALLPPAIALLGEGGWRRRRRWGLLALAAGAAAGVFLLLTPFLVLDPGLYLRNLGTTWRDYATKGAMLGGSHLGVLVHGARALLSDSFHGWLFGAAGLLGLALAGAAPWLRRDDAARARRLGPAMAAGYVAAYALLYAASSTNPSEHNWLPVAPYVALGAAWIFFRGWEWLARRLPAGSRLPADSRALPAGSPLPAGPHLPTDSQLPAGPHLPADSPLPAGSRRFTRPRRPPADSRLPAGSPMPTGSPIPADSRLFAGPRRLPAWPWHALGIAAFLAACWPMAAADHTWVYLAAVPSTQDLERDHLRRRLAPLGWRVVVREEDCDAQWYGDPAIVDEVKRLAERPAEELELADAELFPANRLNGGESGFYRRRLAAAGGRAELARFEPLPFRAHGPALAALLHPWVARGEPQPLDVFPAGPAPGRLAALLSGRPGPGDVGSLEIWLPPGWRPEQLGSLRVGGRPLMAVLVGRRAGAARLVSERFAIAASGERVVLVLAGGPPAAPELRVNLQRWESGRPRGASSPR
jgi:hypothetical protein